MALAYLKTDPSTQTLVWHTLEGVPITDADDIEELNQSLCDKGGSATALPTYTRTCFLETKINYAIEAARVGAPASATKGKVHRYSYTAAQFANGYELELDADGVLTPVGGASVTERTTSSIAANNTTSLERWEFDFYVQRYKTTGANAGKPIRLCIEDLDTVANGASSHIQVSVSDDGRPLRDRSATKTVASAELGTSYTFPDDWAGRTVRVVLVGEANTNFRGRIKYDDGTPDEANLDITSIVHLPGTGPAPTPEEQRKVTRRVDDTGASPEVWTDPNGDEVKYLSLHQPLVQVDSSFMPFGCSASLIGDQLTVTSLFGGVTPPLKVSVFDGGELHDVPHAVSVGDTSDETELDIADYAIRVHDAAGNVSGVKQGVTLVGDPVDSFVPLRITDTVDGANSTLSAIRSNNADDPGGYVVDYGSQIGGNFDTRTFTVSPSDQFVTLVSADELRINQGTDVLGEVDAVICIPGSSYTSGRDGVISFITDNTFYPRFSIDGHDISFQVVDTTGSPLGPVQTLKPGGDYEWAGVYLSVLNIRLPFVHNGEDVCIRVIDNSTDIGAGNAGWYWRMRAFTVYEGRFAQAGVSYIYRVNSAVQSRGIDGTGYITRAVDDLSSVDLVYVYARLNASGDWSSEDTEIAIQTSFDGGPYEDVVRYTGDWGTNKLKDLTTFLSTPIPAHAISTGQLRVCVTGDGTGGLIANVFDLTYKEYAP